MVGQSLWWACRVIPARVKFSSRLKTSETNATEELPAGSYGDET